jgi:predicted dehydrogenase
MSDKLRFALVGAGAISQSWAQAFESCANAQLVAVADSRLDAAAALAHNFNCPSFESHKAMADAVKFDAAIVSTPPVTHPEISCHLLERGIHVLCEKPLAIDSANAQHMMETAKKHNTTLTMGSKFRYVEDVIKAKSIVASGILGEIVLFENAFTARVDMAARWNSNPKVSGGGVLIDNGAHSIDIIRYFLGPIADVQVIEG